MTRPTFERATRRRVKLRMGLVGVSGSGKTYTSLRIAHALADGGLVAVIDTEHGSASRYAEMPCPDGGVFDFVVCELTSYSPRDYMQAIKAAEDAGAAVIVLDSISHAWDGEGGVMDIVDHAAAKARGNSFAGWREGTPAHRFLIESMLKCNAHLIATMRSKTEYVLEEVNGRKVPRKVGMAPVQRAGMEYEFDVVGDIDDNHALTVSKTRCPALDGKTWRQPGADVAAILKEWMQTGAAPKAPPVKRWTPEAQRKFFAELAEVLGKGGPTYEEVAKWCEHLGRPRPSGMDDASRAKLIAHLATKEGRAALAEWVTGGDQ